jgi:hypothetical protein
MGGEQAIALRMQVQRHPRPEIWQKYGSNSFCLHAIPTFFLADSLFAQESPQHIYQSRTAKVVPTIDLFTTLAQVMFQVPQIRRLLDLAGHLLCSLNHFVQFPTQSTVESYASDGFSRPRPSWLVLVGIAGLVCRRACSDPPGGGILFLAQMTFLPAC